MLVQVCGHKLGRNLEIIIQKHSRPGGDKFVLGKAKGMLELLTCRLTHFNLAHNTILLDPDDFAFLKEFSDDPSVEVSKVPVSQL